MNIRKANQLIESVKRTLGEAAEVEREELPKDKQAAVKNVEQHMKAKATQFFDGIHGFIVIFSINSGRLGKDSLEHLVKVPGLRWMECSGNSLTIGF